MACQLRRVCLWQVQWERRCQWSSKRETEVEQILTNTTTLTMSSREIAELVEARHDSVKRTIERLEDRGVIAQPPLVDERVTDSAGRPRFVGVYQINKRDSDVIVAQLSPEFTARLVDRWQELEAQAAKPPALPGDYLSALKALVTFTESQEKPSG